MNRLLEIGFIRVGYWSLNEDQIRYTLTSHRTAKNVLYGFISNGVIMYIGKTTMQLFQRMNGYQNPGATQHTNIRVNNEISLLLEQNIPIDIFILADNGLLKYGDFIFNFAAGLEDSLINKIKPKWNYFGKKRTDEDINSENASLAKGPVVNFAEPQLTTTFEIKVGKAYYNQGFFNVSVKHNNFFGGDGEIIEIQLGNNPENIINGYINRTANPNHTPRIMVGIDYTNWIQQHFQQGDTLRVDVFSPVSIRLSEN